MPAHATGTRTGTAAYTGSGAHTYATTGECGQPTRARQMSALPGHGIAQPAGQVVEDRAEAHPVGTNPGVGGWT